MARVNDILRVVQANAGGVKFCFERELQRAPGLEGKVTLTWFISPEGRVGRVYVSSSTLGSRRVEECMLRQVRR